MSVLVPRSVTQSPRRRDAAHAAHPLGVIDWRAHFAAVLNGLVAMRRSVERWDDDPALLARVLAQDMRWIALRLRSRHIPRQTKARFPEIPWLGISAWLARENALEKVGVRPTTKDTAIIDFARAAPALTGPLRRLQKELLMTAVDGNERNGVLAWEERASFAHVTLRIPADRAHFVLEALERAYDEVDAPTLARIREALATIDGALSALGVTTLWAIGSVARGSATPASDIDLLYEAAPAENAWQLWCDLLALLEGTLGRVIDLHEAARLPARSRAGAVTVWKRRGSGSGRKHRATA